MSEENKDKKLRYWNLFFACVYIFFITYPFLDAYVFRRVSFDQQIDPEFMSGLLAASSILFGFSSLLVLNQKRISKRLFILLFVPLFLIIISGSAISDAALGRGTGIRALLILASGFNANILTTAFLVGFFFRFLGEDEEKERIQDVQPETSMKENEG